MPFLQDIDMVFFTGDLIPHDNWMRTKEMNREQYNKAMGLIRQYFGNKTLFNIVGNHEPYPTNVYE
jgi:hypothetical protein